MRKEHSKSLEALDPGAGPETLVRTPAHLASDWIARLDNGETGHEAHGMAKAMIEDFCQAAWHRLPQNPLIVEWLAGRLSKVLNYETYAERAATGKAPPLSSQKVFSLMPKPTHRSDGRGWQTAMNVAIWLKLTEMRGYSPKDAKGFAAEAFGCDLRTIDRYKRDGNEGLDGTTFSDAAIERFEHQFAEIGKRLPAKK